MKKTIALIMALMLIPIYGYAQVRNASSATLSHTRTNTTNLAVTGLDVDGNPGYIALTGTITETGDSLPEEYYLWVDTTGDLCIASAPAVSGHRNFPDGDWSASDFPCVKVGGQS